MLNSNFKDLTLKMMKILKDKNSYKRIKKRIRNSKEIKRLINLLKITAQKQVLRQTDKKPPKIKKVFN
jgi:hypothetical protein